MSEKSSFHLFGAQHLPQPGASMAVRWSAGTHPGKRRQNNEDAFLLLTFDQKEMHYLGKSGEATLHGRDLIFAVSDGMGGGPAGEFASRIAVDKLAQLLPGAFRLGAAGIRPDRAGMLGEVFFQIHKEMSKLSFFYEECREMGATLSLVWLTPGWLFFGHVGDSRIYLLPKDHPEEEKLRQITHDHTHVGWLYRQGKINERQARGHPGRHSLQQMLGAGRQFLEPQLGVVECHSGDRFLICSDGLVEALWDRQLKDLLAGWNTSTAETVAAGVSAFLEEALEGPAQDNITALIFEIV